MEAILLFLLSIFISKIIIVSHPGGSKYLQNTFYQLDGRERTSF
jgi:hypothetical protein